VIYKLVACMWAGRRNFKQVREAFLCIRAVPWVPGQGDSCPSGP
jgi:hypothetical protein